MLKIASTIIFSLLFSFCLQAQLPTPALKKEAQFQDHKWMPFYNMKKKRNTSFFQGNKKKKNYFEGWYFKMVAQDGVSIISVIPGIALSEDGQQQHAFIQIINGLTAQTSYHRFPIEAFSFSRKEFAVKIGDNYFSKDKLVLNIDDEQGQVSGEVSMTNLTKYSDKKIGSRKIMGWYRRVGQLNINQQAHNFGGGKGYIEKDWGSSMPSAWIWIQSNNFENANTSFMLSIADIPFIGKSFNGFLGFFYYQGKVYRFATYTRSDISLEILDEDSVRIKIKNRKETIEIEAKRNSAGLLMAPVAGSMDRRIPESIDAEITIKLFDKSGTLLYSDKSTIAGFELVGDIEGLKEGLN